MKITVLHLNTNNSSRKRFTATRHDCSANVTFKTWSSVFSQSEFVFSITKSWNSSSRHSCACAGLSWLNQRSWRVVQLSLKKSSF